MKNLNLTDNGGYPMAQDDFNWLQQAYTEAIQGICAQGGAGPYVLSGAVITRTLSLGTVYNYSITNGWVWYEGNLIRVAAMGPVAIDESVDIAMLVITATSLPLTFNNATVNDVINDATIGIGAYAIGTGDDAGKFAYSHLVPWGRDAAWTHVAVATGAGAGTCSGDIYYKRNFVNNTLLVRGSVLITTPTDCPALPARLMVDVAFLPYAPSNNGPEVFSTTPIIDPANDLLKDHSGGYHDQLSGGLSVGGNLYLNFVLPDSGITEYAVSFSRVISLD